MQSVCEIFKAEIEVKKSKFIAFLCPLKEFKILLERLKKEHLKAVHFVWALRSLNQFNQIVEDKSDDFEPKNTAGLPILNVLRGAQLVNIGLIVVRYFGGIKLGTGGLVKAYSNAANEAIKKAHFIELKKEFELEISLSLFAQFEHFLKKEDLEFQKRFEDKKVFLRLFLNESEKEKLNIFLKNFPILSPLS